MVDLTLGINPAQDAIANYIAERNKQDKDLEKACQKENKTIDGVMKYIYGQAKELAKKNMAMVDDPTVYGWAVHYILEDSLDCEKKEESHEDFLAKYRAEHPVVIPPVVPQKDLSGQLTFDF